IKLNIIIKNIEKIKIFYSIINKENKNKERIFNKKKEKELLIDSDFVGVGKVALSMMIPVLSTMEANLNYLPTAVISNNFDYGEAAVQELNDFMEQSKDMWEKHKLRFDFISTGIVMNTKQVDVVKEIIDLHENRPIIISDP